jgi:hypothetical protein
MMHLRPREPRERKWAHGCGIGDTVIEVSSFVVFDGALDTCCIMKLREMSGMQLDGIS